MAYDDLTSNANANFWPGHIVAVSVNHPLSIPRILVPLSDVLLLISNKTLSLFPPQGSSSSKFSEEFLNINNAGTRKVNVDLFGVRGVVFIVIAMKVRVVFKD